MAQVYKTKKIVKAKGKASGSLVIQAPELKDYVNKEVVIRVSIE